jgi:hypothetical protein
MDQALRALLRPRHLIVTLVVALATGALGVTAAGVSEGTPAQAGSAWDLPFVVPSAHEGDHGHYVHAGGHDGRTDGYWPDAVDFAWVGPGSAYNGTGAQVLVNRLAYHEVREGWQPEALNIVPGGHTEIDGNFESNQTYVDSREGLYPGGNVTSVDNIRYVSFVGQERPLSIWCGIVNPLQGKTVDLRASAADDTTCWNGPGSWNVDRVFVIATKVGGADGGRVAVFEGRYNDGFLEPHTFLRSYYREGVAYPIRLEYVSGDVGGDCDCSAIYLLDGLTVGSTPLAAEPRVLAPAPPAATMAPTTETGPDAAGVEHPFTLAEAWDHARDDDTYTELADYRAAHPDSAIGQAMYEVHTQDSRIMHRWVIVLTDGAQQYAFMVERTDATQPTLPVVPPVAPPATQPLPAPSYRYERLTNGWEDGQYPTLDAWPADMPTVASMMQAWQAFSGSEEPANAWGFDLRCGTAPDGSCQPQATYSAGLKQDDFDGVATIASHRTIWQDELEFGADGRASGAFTRATTMDTTVDALPDAEPTPAGGGVAILVAAAYFLWPLARGGGAGLFSRVHKDKLLDNPLRQQLVQRIEAEPGIHHNALVRELGKGKGAAEHHLDKLVDARIVLRHRGTGYTCYFPMGTDRRDMAAAPAVKSDGARQVLEALRNGVPGVRGIAIATGLSPSTVSHHLERLRAAGLVVGDGHSGYHAATGRDPGVAAA